MAQPTSVATTVFKWSNRYPTHGYILERQSGYQPDIGTCGTATTCSDACGNEFITCEANTDLALFCYNPSHGQTCCKNGDGRACDAGYYCARDLSDKTWCCENKYNAAQCASIYGLPTLITGLPATSTTSNTGSSTTDPPQPSTTSNDPTTTTSTTAATTQHNTSAIIASTGYLNSTSTSRPVILTAAAPLNSASMKRVAVLCIIAAALLNI